MELPCVALSEASSNRRINSAEESDAESAEPCNRDKALEGPEEDDRDEEGEGTLARASSISVRSLL